MEYDYKIKVREIIFYLASFGMMDGYDNGENINKGGLNMVIGTNELLILLLLMIIVIAIIRYMSGKTGQQKRQHIIIQDCPKCGLRDDKDSKFCIDCGSKF